MTAPVETPAGSVPAAASAGDGPPPPSSEPGSAYDTLDAVRAVTLAHGIASTAEALRAGYASHADDVPGDVVLALGEVVELGHHVGDTAAATSTNPLYTPAGARDAAARVLGPTAIRRLGNLDAHLARGIGDADATQRQQEQAGRTPPSGEYERLRQLELARVVRESGATPAERVAFVNRGSVELQRAVVAQGAELAGLENEFITLVQRRLESPDLRAAREAHTVAQGRRQRVLQLVRDLRAIAVAVSDSDKLARCGAHQTARSRHVEGTADRVFQGTQAAPGMVSRPLTTRSAANDNRNRGVDSRGGLAGSVRGPAHAAHG